ncbi:MSP domain protein, partial [Ancylostoma caninum]
MLAGVRLNTAGSGETNATSLPIVFLDQTLLVFDVEQTKNASQVINISRAPKVGLVSYRFQEKNGVQTNAPTRYIVNPNCGILEDEKPVPVKIELVGNRYNPQHKLVLQATLIEKKDDWKTIWDDPKTEEPGVVETKWIELGTTLMNLEHALNLADPENAKDSISVVQLLNASTSRGSARVKELEGRLSSEPNTAPR